ncbi:hypothetical protein E2C01_034805 [Portunus trituberculatus]|uniref:Uncharacterized protein n=1 Tax=Portunus trituberculatus TaxID=210409 RepID=A0A5B7F7L0_PORTR|nr:hypothetical protein [Portunus trituberculatus]
MFCKVKHKQVTNASGFFREAFTNSIGLNVGFLNPTVHKISRVLRLTLLGCPYHLVNPTHRDMTFAHSTADQHKVIGV